MSSQRIPDVEQGSCATGGFVGTKSSIDAVLCRSIELGAAPGIVAAAATADGSSYVAAFGTAEAGGRQPMGSDALFYIASMTKAITSVAAMQLVESGALTLDGALDEVLPQLGRVQVLQGFDGAGQARLRAPRRCITLGHLLTHTAGFAYGHWNSDVKQYAEQAEITDVLSGRELSLSLPLVSDPGTEWHYGISTDFVGKAVEVASGLRLDTYFSRHIFEPLGLHDTYYRVPDSERHRVAPIHCRLSDGGFSPVNFEPATVPEFLAGGVGLYSTARDYLVFTRMILHDGALNDRRILSASSIREMARNQLHGMVVPRLESQNRFWSEDVDLFPGQRKHWGLGFLINTERSAAGRSPGSLGWAGACNTHF